MNRRVLSLAVLVCAVLVGCGGTEVGSQVEETGTVSEALVTCSANCFYGPNVSCTGVTCSATHNSHVTCDGSSTYCMTADEVCGSNAYSCEGLHGTACAPNKAKQACCGGGQWPGNCLCSNGTWTCPL